MSRNEGATNAPTRHVLEGAILQLRLQRDELLLATRDIMKHKGYKLNRIKIDH